MPLITRNLFVDSLQPGLGLVVFSRLLPVSPSSNFPTRFGRSLRGLMMPAIFAAVSANILRVYTLSRSSAWAASLQPSEFATPLLALQLTLITPARWLVSISIAHLWST